MEYIHGFLKTQLQKIKRGELYSQLPHNALNHALFSLSFLNVDTHKQSAMNRFWHDGTRVTFAKTKWKDSCTGLWKKTEHSFNMGSRSCLCFFTGRKRDSMAPCTYAEENPQWVLRPSQRSWSERLLNLRSWLSDVIMLQPEKWRRLWWLWWFLSSWYTCHTDFKTLVSPLYSRASPRMLAACLVLHPHYILGHRTHFCQYSIYLLLKWEVWTTGASETSPPWEKDSLK